MTKVKICGITNSKDAEFAVQCGADALGFVFAKSPRQISPAKAKAIIKKIGPFVMSVGVFVNDPLDCVLQVVSECRLDAVQLHGEETPLYTKGLGSCKVIKAFRVGVGFAARETRDYNVAAFLFDTGQSGKYGGTGRCFDWDILKSTRWNKPFIVSGGLNASNVCRAIRLFSPYAVDVSSGVERSPGKKDHRLLKEFIRNAKKK